MFAVTAVLVGTVDIDGEFDGPVVTVEFRREVVFDGSTPSLIEFFLNRVSPPDDRCNVGVVVRLEQRETLAVVEFAVEIDGFDGEVEVFEETEKLREDTTGGVAVGETAHRQRVAFVPHTRVESSVGVECGGSVLGFRMVEAICLVFVAVVGSQVEVNHDLHLLRKEFENIPLEQRVPDHLDGIEVELRAEMVENIGSRRRILTDVTEFGDRGPLDRDRRSHRSSG